MTSYLTGGVSFERRNNSACVYVAHMFEPYPMTQDALNLAWELAMVVRGEAAADGPLLDSYDEERRGTDERICRAIEAGAHGASSRSPLAFLVRGRMQVH